jgi:hypothetical protein
VGLSDEHREGQFQIRKRGEQVGNIVVEVAIDRLEAVADEQPRDARPENPVVVEQRS